MGPQRQAAALRPAACRGNAGRKAEAKRAPVRTGRNGTGLRQALGLALLLAFQLIAGGFALGASAAPLDAYGNPICAPGASHSGFASGAGGHGRIPACCQLGCPTADGAVLPSDAADAWVPRPIRRGAADGRRDGYRIAAKAPWRPGNPRAPPAA